MKKINQKKSIKHNFIVIMIPIMTSWGVSDHISWFKIISRWKIFYIYSLISPIYRESVRDLKKIRPW